MKEGSVCHAYFPLRHVTHVEPLVKHLIYLLMGVSSSVLSTFDPLFSNMVHGVSLNKITVGMIEKLLGL